MELRMTLACQNLKFLTNRSGWNQALATHTHKEADLLSAKTTGESTVLVKSRSPEDHKPEAHTWLHFTWALR